LHSVALITELGGGPALKRITPSLVEQKVRCPVLVDTGVATTTY
jgi:hypothetical protein